MAKLLLLFVALSVLSFALTCRATTYTVGDTSGWDISSSLDTWTAGKQFVVGDVLVFNYASSDSVCTVDQASYQTCNTTNTIECYANGNTSIPLTTPGDEYFISNNRLYCYSGMKLHVFVISNQTVAPAAAPSTSIPTATPSKSSNPSVISSSSIAISFGLDSLFLAALGLMGILSFLL